MAADPRSRARVPLQVGPIHVVPLLADLKWPLVRGSFVLENANAIKIWPHNPGGHWRGGPYKMGTTVHIYTRDLIYCSLCFPEYVWQDSASVSVPV